MTDHPEELENEGDETIIASQPELYLAALEDRNKEAPPFNRGVDVSADEMPEETAEILDEEDAEEESEDDCTIIAEMPFDGRVGQLVAGRYTIMRIVGEGGMAMVYEAEELGTKRMCALKVLKPHSAQGQWRKRFEREVRIAAMMKSPYIVEQFDAGVLPDNRPYLVQELLYGETLADKLGEGPIDTRTAVSYTLGILEALRIAHGHGIIHRDIKPENIFLAKTPSGIIPKVLDFGFAFDLEEETDHRLTAVGMAVGTPRYMAPEQFVSLATVSARTDLYAVGLMLHEMLRGEPTFSGEEEMIPPKIKGISYGPRLGWVHMHCPPPPIPGIPPRLAALIAGLLEKDPEKRIQTAEEAESLLQHVFDPGPEEPVIELRNAISTGQQRAILNQTQPPMQRGYATTMPTMQRQAVYRTMQQPITHPYPAVSQVPSNQRRLFGLQKTDWILLIIAAITITIVTVALIWSFR